MLIPCELLFVSMLKRHVYGISILYSLCRSVCLFLHVVKMPKGASAARARCVLIVKKLIKCTLKI